MDGDSNCFVAGSSRLRAFVAQRRRRVLHQVVLEVDLRAGDVVEGAE